MGVSEPLLEWIRGIMKEKGLNTAALASRTKLPRARMRKLLTGREPMLVDELLQITNALEVSAADFGLLPEGTELAEPTEGGPSLAVVGAEPDGAAELAAQLNPWGNHSRQLFQVGVALGCDFLFLADASQLEGSGIPKHILSRYAGSEMPIRLDALYHEHILPRYSEEGVTLSLGFDALYECVIPWAAIKRVMFFPVPWEPPEEQEPVEEESDDKRPPFLRLVK